MAGSTACELMAKISWTSRAPASDWAWLVANSTDSRALVRPSSASFSALATDSLAKKANWSIAASLAAVTWSILNMVWLLVSGCGSQSYVALHKCHFRPNPDQVKGFRDFFVAVQHDNGNQGFRPAPRLRPPASRCALPADVPLKGQKKGARRRL